MGRYMSFLLVIQLLLSASYYFITAEGPDETACYCTPDEARLVQSDYHRLWSTTTTREKLSIMETILDNLRRSHPHYATIYRPSDEGDQEKGVLAANDVQQLQQMSSVRVMLDIAHRPDLLRTVATFYRSKIWQYRYAQRGYFQHIHREAADAFIQLVNPSHYTAWLNCLHLVARELERAGDELSIEASCNVETAVFPYNPISGTILLRQKLNGGPTTFEFNLSGFNTTLAGDIHGAHVHAGSSVTEKCRLTQAHYNPINTSHGGLTDEKSHPGDLGNIRHDWAGKVQITLVKDHASLIGQYSIIGRAIVIHESEDDLGRGPYPDSKTGGHSGPRIACCLIKEMH